MVAGLTGGCASEPTFKPEVAGPGARFSQGGVVYSIPPKNPILKMKLISMVIPKEMLHVRMYFKQQAATGEEYIDPQEQTIVLPDSTEEIHPSKVHASADNKPLVKLSNQKQQAIELLFAVPKVGHDYPYVKLNWKVHYSANGQDQTEGETERFDFVEKPSLDKGVGQYSGDLEFPNIEYGPISDAWATPGWAWW